jgi:hypothetical protein
MKEIKVKDEHRTNELSLRPGGSEVTVKYGDGRVLTYDKIKNPEAYVNRLSKLDISEILVNGTKVWPDEFPR